MILLDKTTLFQEIIEYGSEISLLEFSGLVFGLLCVYFLIKQNIFTWFCGIVYVLISFVIFWQTKLYGDFLLHIVFLCLNIYGWIEWSKGKRPEEKIHVTTLTMKNSIITLLLSMVGILIFAQLLIYGPGLIRDMQPASLPYWDSATSVLSIAGMWLTARKKLENWYYWLVVDILATGIYFYKGIYFYSLLYFIYIGMAISGYLSWKQSMQIKTP